MDGFACNRDIGRTLLAVAGFGIVSFACQSRPFAADCSSLAGKTFGAATIIGATSVSPPSRAKAFHNATAPNFSYGQHERTSDFRQEIVDGDCWRRSP
jgi:hypothetical protein